MCSSSSADARAGKAVSRLVGIALVSLVLVRTVWGQPFPQAPSSVAVAQVAVKACFPELKGRGWMAEMIIAPGVDHPMWSAFPTVGLRLGPPGQRLMTDGLSGSALVAALWDFPLSGFVELFADGRLSQVLFYGTHVHSRDGLAFAKLVGEHPAWTAAEITTALKQAGAQYGPEDREAFLRQLNPERFAPLLGTLSGIEAVFMMPEQYAPGSPTLSEPRWAVSAEARIGRGPRYCYTLGFEPFEGRLRSIRDCGVPGR